MISIEPFIYNMQFTAIYWVVDRVQSFIILFVKWTNKADINCTSKWTNISQFEIYLFEKYGRIQQVFSNSLKERQMCSLSNFRKFHRPIYSWYTVYIVNRKSSRLSLYTDILYSKPWQCKNTRQKNTIYAGIVILCHEKLFLYLVAFSKFQSNLMFFEIINI